MKLSNFLLILFLVLAPCEQNFQNSGVLCDYVPNSGPQKSSCFHMANGCYKKSHLESDGQTGDSLPVKVHYESSEMEKCDKKLKIKEEELCPQELEVLKEVAAKSKASEKSRTQEQGICDYPDRKVKVDFAENDFKCGSNMKMVNVWCAECEQCELQVKASGDGVLLNCKDCRELPSDEVVFPSGNNKKIVTLP